MQYEKMRVNEKVFKCNCISQKKCGKKSMEDAAPHYTHLGALLLDQSYTASGQQGTKAELAWGCL